MSITTRTDIANSMAVDAFDPERLFRHRHSVGSFLKDYQRQATAAAGLKLSGLRAMAPHLLHVISDEKTMHAAWQHLSEHGSPAPGPDGVTYTDLAPPQVWEWCRGVRDDIRSGRFTRAEERVVRIPKGPGRGHRELTVQSVFDRVVARAISEVLTPLLDPLFLPCSHGFRPHRGLLTALAAAEMQYVAEGRTTWVSADLRNAFPSVPIGRLLQICGKYLPDADLLAFFAAITKPGSGAGLRQGCPLSPLLLNWYLHHLNDCKWARDQPDVGLIRFADDILLLCRSTTQARSAYRSLTDLVGAAGFTLKEGEIESVRRVATGEAVTFMGFGIQKGEEGLVYTLTEAAWTGLAEAFVTAHERPHSPVAATRALLGWLASKGPCYPACDKPRTYARIRHLAEQSGFDELPPAAELKGWWQTAYARWCKLRKEAARNNWGGK